MILSINISSISSTHFNDRVFRKPNKELILGKNQLRLMQTISPQSKKNPQKMQNAITNSKEGFLIQTQTNPLICFAIQPQQAAVHAKVTVQTKMRISTEKWKQLKLILPLDRNAYAALTSHWGTLSFTKLNPYIKNITFQKIFWGTSQVCFPLHSDIFRSLTSI